MRLFFGFVFLACATISSFKDMQHSAMMFLVVSCYSFIMAELEVIKDKLK